MICWEFAKSFPAFSFAQVCEHVGAIDNKAEFARGQEILEKTDLSSADMPTGSVGANTAVGYDILVHHDMYNQTEFLDSFGVEMGKMGLKPNAQIVNQEGPIGFGSL